MSETTPTKTERLTQDEKISIVRCAILDRFLDTGKWSTVAELAEHLGWSVSRVRSVINRLGREIDARQEDRDSYSRDYPGFRAGVHTLWTYAPTRERLRKMILGLRMVSA